MVRLPISPSPLTLRALCAGWLSLLCVGLLLPSSLEASPEQGEHRVAKASKKSSSKSKDSKKKTDSAKSEPKKASATKDGATKDGATKSSSSKDSAQKVEPPAPAREEPRSAEPPARGRIESKLVPDLADLPIEPLVATRELGDFTWTPDGKRLVVVTDLSGSPNLWAVDINGVGWPQQLTFGDSPVFHPRVSPDGRFLLYESEGEHGDTRDLFVIPMVGGVPYNLTSSPSVDERQAEWSPDGKLIAYMSDQETPGRYQIYLNSLKNGRSAGSPRRISRSLQSSTLPIWSRDGQQLLVSRFRSPRDANLVVLDVSSGAEKVLTPHQGEERWLAAAWSPDGKQVLATSNAQGQEDAVIVDVETMTRTFVTRQAQGEAIALDWSPTEPRLAWTINVQASLNLLTGTPTAMSRGVPVRVRRGELDAARFSPDGRFLAFRYATAQRARDLWIFDLSRSVARQITFSMVSGVQPEQLVEPVPVTYSSWDGTTLGAWLYVPHNLPNDARRPVIVWAHDGPAQQVQNGFDPLLQLLANRGWVVLAPNYRGSLGQGRAFESLNDLDWGGGDLHDLAAAVGFLKTIPYADPGRAVLMGRGYGGYLAQLGMSRIPELWMAGVSLGGLLELPLARERASAAWRTLMESELGSPEEHPALWRDRSPRYFLENVRAPMFWSLESEQRLITWEEASAVQQALRTRGLPLELKQVPARELSGSTRPARSALYRAVLQFLDKYAPAR